MSCPVQCKACAREAADRTAIRLETLREVRERLCKDLATWRRSVASVDRMIAEEEAKL